MKPFTYLSITRGMAFILVPALFMGCKKDTVSTDPSSNGSIIRSGAESLAQSGLSQTRTATLVNYNLKRALVTNYVPTTVASSFAMDDGKYGSTIKLTSRVDYSLLVLQGFQFNIPSNATIENIAVKARRFKTGKGEIKEGNARLVMRRERPDLPEWWEQYGALLANPNYFPAIESDVNYFQTGSGVLVFDNVSYPYQWTPARVNDLYFGIMFQTYIPEEIIGARLVVSYDLVEITVNYSIP